MPLLVFASLPSPAWADTLASGTAPGIPWVRLLLSFAFCIALAWGAVVMLKHYQRRGIGNPLKELFAKQGAAPSRRIAIIETRRAGLHTDLCLVDCDGETYFLALTPAGVSVLDQGLRKAAE
jgi:hypothetical protein